MKVIFVNDVAGVAKRNSVRDVSDGYAVNYLLPKGLAVIATSEKILSLDQQQEFEAKYSKKKLNRASGLSSQLNNKLIKILSKASPTGTLYAAITPEVIVKAVAEQFNISLEPTQIEIVNHLKNIGRHEVKILFHSQVKTSLFVDIEPI